MKIIFTLFLFASIYAFALNFEGDLYKKGTHELLFHQKRWQELMSDKKTKVLSEFKDPSGNLAVEEDIFFGSQGLERYEIHHKQLQEEGSLEIREGKALFSWKKKNGAEKKAEESATDNLIIGPTTLEFLQKNWKALIEGNSVDARFAVLDRRETVGFKFFKLRKDTFETHEVVIVKMRPSSLLISALVDPLYFTFSLDGSKLYALTGRTLPKVKVNDVWKDLDADIVYHDVL